MSDLEDRLREDLQREADDFDPSPDLADRVAARIERRTQRKRVLAAAAAVLVVVATAGGVMALRREPDEGGIHMQGEGRDSTTTTEPEPEETTTTTAATSTSSTTVPQQRIPDVALTPSTTTTTAATPTFDPTTPLSPSGIGPVRAGMTIREAEEVLGGFTLGVNMDNWVGYGRSCGTFYLRESEATPLFVARTPGLVPSDDPKTAVIDAVQSGRTAEGITYDSTVDDVRATYGEPSRIEPDRFDDDPTAQILIYERDGYSYGFRVRGRDVVDIASGHVTGLAEFEPCAA